MLTSGNKLDIGILKNLRTQLLPPSFSVSPSGHAEKKINKMETVQDTFMTIDMSNIFYFA